MNIADFAGIESKEDKKRSMNTDSVYDVKIGQLVTGQDKHWALLRQSGEG